MTGLFPARLARRYRLWLSSDAVHFLSQTRYGIAYAVLVDPGSTLLLVPLFEPLEYEQSIPKKLAALLVRDLTRVPV